jgi:hypothetical protein
MPIFTLLSTSLLLAVATPIAQNDCAIDSMATQAPEFQRPSSEIVYTLTTTEDSAYRGSGRREASDCT